MAAVAARADVQRAGGGQKGRGPAPPASPLPAHHQPAAPPHPRAHPLPTSCACSCSSGPGSLCTSPKMVTRALASPVHPGICTTTLHLGSSSRLRVWMASGDRLRRAGAAGGRQAGREGSEGGGGGPAGEALRDTTCQGREEARRGQ